MSQTICKSSKSKKSKKEIKETKRDISSDAESDDSQTICKSSKSKKGKRKSRIPKGTLAVMLKVITVKQNINLSRSLQRKL